MDLVTDLQYKINIQKVEIEDNQSELEKQKNKIGELEFEIYELRSYEFEQLKDAKDILQNENKCLIERIEKDEVNFYLNLFFVLFMNHFLKKQLKVTQNQLQLTQNQLKSSISQIDADKKNFVKKIDALVIDNSDIKVFYKYEFKFLIYFWRKCSGKANLKMPKF